MMVNKAARGLEYVYIYCKPSTSSIQVYPCDGTVRLDHVEFVTIIAW